MRWRKQARGIPAAGLHPPTLARPLTRAPACPASPSSRAPPLLPLSLSLSQVDAVTGQMQKNIESALRNTDRIEDIDEKAVVLADSANKFKQGGAALKRKMRCRKWKMYALFGFLIALILTIIIASLS